MMKVDIQADVNVGLRWTDCYLTGREQRTHVRGTYISLAKMISGVPHCSLLKMHEVKRTEKHCTKILDTVQQQSEKWLMKFNIGKCKVPVMKIRKGLNILGETNYNSCTVKGTPIDIMLNLLLEYHKRRITRGASFNILLTSNLP